MTQLLSLCLHDALGTASFAEVLICGGDFHLCGGLKTMIPSSILQD